MLIIFAFYEVDPRKESGQSLFRQYAGKKGKIVLDAKWAIECINTGQLQTYHTNWAGCKVTGKEQYVSWSRMCSSEHTETRLV